MLKDYFYNNSLLLFDFDGLLVNTELLHYQCYKIALQQRGYEFPWDFNTYSQFAHGSNTLGEKVYAACPGLLQEYPSWETIRAFKQEIYQSMLQIESISLMPGVDKLLEYLNKNCRSYGVVTNATKQQVIAIRDQHKILQEIPFWITREDVKCPKPAPDCYLLAKRVYGKNYKKFLGFEDTLKGVSALQSANIPAVLICDNSHPQLEILNPRSTCTHFTDFNQFFEHIALV